ncbi:unnamed protein product [Owenia fusiformis]|uniref:Uncharacterized protein n=1 Tax=Owenia fusiformis TaxID=6347 RepID=A0A8J1TLY4_OWEFU|nr:unnamed protein product [Owenia fusiformis]
MTTQSLTSSSSCEKGVMRLPRRLCVTMVFAAAAVMFMYLIYFNNEFLMSKVRNDEISSTHNPLLVGVVDENPAIGISGQLEYDQQLEEYNDTKSSKLNMTLLSHHYHKVLILTPINNAERHLGHYFELLNNFSYPHHLISVALGEDSSYDETLKTAVELAQKYRKITNFRKIDIYELDHHWKPPTNDRHDLFIQGPRRNHLAKARNRLLSSALSDEDYVLWIDSDVREIPPNVMQYLIAAQKDVVVPSCLYRKGDNSLDDYDRNTWRETNESLAHLAAMSPNQLMVEGYARTRRRYLWSLRFEGDVVPIDGVGGCVLMIRADCHRDGLTFPPFVYKHHIETEGLAKIAKEMGFSIAGLPRLKVFH